MDTGQRPLGEESPWGKKALGGLRTYRLAQVRAGLFGQEAYPTLAGKASALMHSLAGNHALADGNKRLALLATAVFLRINGYRLDMTDDEAFDLTVSVAAGQLDAAGIEKRLRLIVVSDDA
jgi:death on curing protein